MTIKNCYFKVITAIIRKLQYWLGATTVGVRTLVVDQQQRVLLVKHTYTPGWHFPGGGVGRRETAVSAAVRELQEETGVIAQQRPQLFGVYYHQVQGVDDYPILYVITDFTIGKTHSHEIAEVSWFSLQALPADITESTYCRIQEFLGLQEPRLGW